jgi:hypothetical protein
MASEHMNVLASPRRTQRRERELRRLLDRFEVLHESTVAQLDRTDAALDRALAHFARSGG